MCSVPRVLFPQTTRTGRLLSSYRHGSWPPACSTSSFTPLQWFQRLRAALWRVFRQQKNSCSALAAMATPRFCSLCMDKERSHSASAGKPHLSRHTFPRGNPWQCKRCHSIGIILLTISCWFYSLYISIGYEIPPTQKKNQNKKIIWKSHSCNTLQQFSLYYKCSFVAGGCGGCLW